MHILKLTYITVIIAGCFRPQSWTSLFKRTIYNIYSLYVISILYVFSLFQLMDIVLNADNTDAFTSTLNLMLTTSVACYKVLVMCLNYENIVSLINCLTEEPFIPLDADEMKIRQQYDKIIRNNTLCYTTLIVGSYVFAVLTSLFTHFKYKQLKYREWIPYNYSSNIIYCLTYLQQMLGGYHCVMANVAIDSLMCALLMHICCQIDILECRIKKIISNQLTLSYCVRHHNQIFEFAQMVNIKFTKIIGFQFMASMMITCSNLYQVAKSTLNTEHISLIMYTSCMLTEIFIYCWFGNEVKLKSLQLINTIFHMEWPVLVNSVRKGLLLIMRRALIPIEVTTIYILTMNLDSFVMFLKTSYSIYNLLTQIK